MSQQSMRGTRLGTNSLETEYNVSFEARSNYIYECAQNHHSELTFSVDAEIPETWECKMCGKEAILLVDGVQIDHSMREEKTPRSHWQMLLERRSVEELQVLLDEQLANLRDRRAAAAKAAVHA